MRRHPRAAGLTSLLAALLLGVAAAAQEAPSAAQDAATAAQEAGTSAPRGFRSLILGMTLDAVKAALRREPLFSFAGDPVVSLLPTGDQQIIETDGSAFIERGYFQFADDRLFLLTLRLDPARVDYFSMLSTLSDKYGNPEELSPRDAVWQFGDVRLALERPVVVKYQDTAVTEQQVDAAEAPLRLRDVTLELFLGMF